VPLASCPPFDGTLSVYNSAVAMYYAPSDPSGIGGMHRERIHARSSWRQGPPRHDCAFVNSNPNLDGMHGLHVVRVLLLFSFEFNDTLYPCSLVQWFEKVGESADEDTGMWIVEPELDANGDRVISVIHLDCIWRAAHLIGVYGTESLSADFSFHDTLDAFRFFYVNKFIDHHASEIAF
jgi:hypothetical protein